MICSLVVFQNKLIEGNFEEAIDLGKSLLDRY